MFDWFTLVSKGCMQARATCTDLVMQLETWQSRMWESSQIELMMLKYSSYCTYSDPVVLLGSVIISY